VATCAFACAADSELPPDDLACGDEIVSLPFEECDVDSPGCDECRVVDGWRCGDLGCETVCGDGVWARAPGNISPVDPTFILYEECDATAPDSPTQCNSSCRVDFRDEACDMNGYWIVRQTDFSLALGVLVQTSSNWFVHRISQVGSGSAGDPGAFTVDESITCGVQVSGSAMVLLPAAGERGMLYRNAQDGQLYLDAGGDPLEGEVERAPRTGTIEETDDGCAFQMTRHYNIRGVDASFLPADFANLPDLDALPPLPSRPEGEDITTPPTGVPNLDVDGDGLAGLSWPVIVGALQGTRATIQRDWTEYGPTTVRAHAGEFAAAGRFDSQEEILQVITSGNPDLLTTLGQPDPDRASVVTFRFLGRQLTDPGVSQVIAGPLKADPDDDMLTCANAKKALVHLDSSEIGGF
jgi:hypothetical protein